MEVLKEANEQVIDPRYTASTEEAEADAQFDECNKELEQLEEIERNSETSTEPMTAHPKFSEDQIEQIMKFMFIQSILTGTSLSPQSIKLILIK